MVSQKIKTTSYRTRIIALALGAVFIVPSASAVYAATSDELQAQINNLSAQNASTQASVSGLQAQASSYQDAINKLQAQINGVQQGIADSQAKQSQLSAQITQNQADLAVKKQSLGADIKAMYVDGTPSTIEMLATSNNLSDYVDKQEYRTRVQSSIQDKLKAIAALQAQLESQKTQVEQLLKQQQDQQAQLASARAQQNSLLAYNQGQQDSYNSQISANSSKISELKKQQIALNARFISGGSGGAAGSGPTCGGGYPARWCEVAQDSVLDSWGMYNRECVSYTAFRVAASGRHMPYWGGYGNANQWDDNARSEGIPVDGNPRAGDVAISNSGTYGHAMYVESVNGDGSINISQYNAALNGRYSTNTISVGSLVFIHFP